jgi:hypothetical protein
MLVARDGPQGPPVALPRLEADSMEQYGGRHVVRVRNERHAHPGADRLILRVQMAGVPAAPERENECHCDGYAKGRRHNE